LIPPFSLIHPSNSCRPFQISVSDAEAKPTLDTIAPIFKVFAPVGGADFTGASIKGLAMKITAIKITPDNINNFFVFILTSFQNNVGEIRNFPSSVFLSLFSLLSLSHSPIQPFPLQNCPV
jgi:hypothetical protein